MSRNKKILRSQRHLSQPKINNINNNPQENIEISSTGLQRTIIYNGKKYKVDLKEG
jgi:hypothetical protein|tara:strand:- start:859 stop:1026 length:168 start_codon:yes stop_codon:yes gene_type:complete